MGNGYKRSFDRKTASGMHCHHQTFLGIMTFRRILSHFRSDNLEVAPSVTGATSDRPLALHNACHAGYPDTVRLLLENGADFSQPAGE